jgi:hypothetical protein
MRYTFQDEYFNNTIGDGYSAYASPFILFVDF